MQSLAPPDPHLADLASLDVVDLGPAGEASLNWGFLDETLHAMRTFGWTFRRALWACIASRARRAGRRESVDVDALTDAIAARLPHGAPPLR